MKESGYNKAPLSLKKRLLLLPPFREGGAVLPKEGISFRTQFPSLTIFINKNVGVEKTKTA